MVKRTKFDLSSFMILIRDLVLHAQLCYISNKSSRIMGKDLKATYPSSVDEEEQLHRCIESHAIKLGVPLRRRDMNATAVEVAIQSFATGSEAEIEWGTPRPKRQCTLGISTTPQRDRMVDLELGLMTPPYSSINRIRQSSTVSSREISPTPGNRKSSTMPPRLPEKRLASDMVRQQTMPTIAFRGYSSKSQGLNGPDEFHPGTAPIWLVGSAGWLKELEYHVGWTRDHPSPFISLTISPIRAMMKARSGAGRFLATFDLTKIPEGSIFRASDFDLHPKKGDGTPIMYQSGGEFMVYGSITKAAVVSIVSVEELAASPPRIPSDPDPFLIGAITNAWRRNFIRMAIRNNGYLMLSFFAGCAVGQLVRRLSAPLSYAEFAPRFDDIVSTIVTDWQFRCKKYEKWQQNEIFCRGVQLGYDGEVLTSSETDRGEVIDLTGDDELDNNILHELEWAAIEDRDDDPDGSFFKSEALEDSSSAIDDDVEEDSQHDGAEESGESDKVTLDYELPEASISEILSMVQNDMQMQDQHSSRDDQSSSQAWIDWPLWTGM